MFGYIRSAGVLKQAVILAVLLMFQPSLPVAADSGWWEVAARKSGHPKPVEYIQSLGVPQAAPGQVNKAYFETLVVKAGHGDTTAQYIVALAYMSGQGVSQNRAAGKRWLKRASDSGHARAAELLDSGVSQNKLLKQPADMANAKVLPAAQKGKQPGHAPGWQGLVDQATDIITGPYSGKYWSWWMGALGLTFLALGFWLATGNTLGVSSSWDRLVSYRESRELERANAELASASRNDVERAMMEATLEQFGDDAPDDMRDYLDEFEASLEAEDLHANESREQRAPYGAHVMFILCMTIGGTVAAVTTGDMQIRMDMGSEFVRFFGSGPGSWIVLLVGGFMIGFGTRMGGGCTSGHALSGCSRLQIGSLVGTAAFFGTAIVVSRLMASMVG